MQLPKLQVSGVAGERQLRGAIERRDRAARDPLASLSRRARPSCPNRPRRSSRFESAATSTDNRELSIAEQAVTTGLLLGVLATTLLLLPQADRVFRLIGNAGAALLVRVPGIVLAALAVEKILEAGSEIVKGMGAG